MEFLQGLLVGLTLTLSVVAFSRKRAARMSDPTTLTFDPAVMTQATNLARNDQQIAAVTLLRDHAPGLSLTAAKAMVDKMARPQPSATSGPAASTAPHQAPAPEEAAGPADMVPSRGDDQVPSTNRLPLEIELQARSLKSQGMVIGAIKLVREHTGLSLADANDLVDGL